MLKFGTQSPNFRLFWLYSSDLKFQLSYHNILFHTTWHIFTIRTTFQSICEHLYVLLCIGAISIMRPHSEYTVVRTLELKGLENVLNMVKLCVMLLITFLLYY